MYIKKVCGYVDNSDVDIKVRKGLLDYFDPPKVESVNYKNWIAVLDLKTCLDCVSKHGQIYLNSATVDPEPPLHYNCRCQVKKMEAIKAGLGTKEGNNGADWWLKLFGILPEYYISEDEAMYYGWRKGKSPVRYVPGKMIFGGIYYNSNGHLPDTPGRIWYEADINYYEGRRNRHRILWSNDGLIFITYDHYMTFYEII